jgi:hypothetical protein
MTVEDRPRATIETKLNEWLLALTRTELPEAECERVDRSGQAQPRAPHRAGDQHRQDERDELRDLQCHEFTFVRRVAFTPSAAFASC